MIHKNNLGFIFGKSGKILGLIIFIAGIFISLFSWIGITTILVGGFLAFTYSAVIIKPSEKLIFYNTYFWGVIKYGYKLKIDESMHFEIINEPLTKVVLLNSDNKILSDIKICEDKQEAENYINELRNIFFT